MGGMYILQTKVLKKPNKMFRLTLTIQYFWTLIRKHEFNIKTGNHAINTWVPPSQNGERLRRKKRWRFLF